MIRLFTLLSGGKIMVEKYLTHFSYFLCVLNNVTQDAKKIPSEFSITQQQGLVDFLVFVFANYAKFSPDIVI